MLTADALTAQIPVSSRPRSRSVATRRGRTIYYGASGNHMEKRPFDEEYVRRLTEGDPSVERHFTSYFGELLGIKLRSHRWSSHDIEDIRQETFLRVFETLRHKGGLEYPERLGAFVYSVCNNIVFEFYRAHARHSTTDPGEHDQVDCAIDMDGALVAQERKELVQGVLEQLPESDRLVLRMVFLEEASREEICKRMKVDRGYLRVLLHRALTRFKALAAARGALAAD